MATKTWVGLGADANWSTSGNWSPSGAPAAGDDLVFGGNTRVSSNNDLTADRSFASITFNANCGSGFTIGGNRITLGGNIVNNSESYTVNITLAMILSGDRTISGSGLTIMIKGVVSGSYGLTIQAHTYLSAVMTYTGATRFSTSAHIGGFGFNGDISASSGITIDTNQQLDIGNDGTTTTYANVITGGGKLYIGTQSAGYYCTVILTGANTYTGLTYLSQGNTLQIGSGGTTGKLSTSSGITGNGGKIIFKRSNTVTEGVDFKGGIEGCELEQAGSGDLVFTGTQVYTGVTTISAGRLILGNGGTGGALSISSAITVTSPGKFAINRSNAVASGTNFKAVISGTGGFSQIGSGKTTLSGTNTYTGATTVDAGELCVTGSTHSSSAVTVNGGTLSGTGTVNGTVTVKTGATLTAGNASRGTLTTGAKTIESGGIISIECDGAGPTTDIITGSSLTLNSGAVLTVASVTNSSTSDAYQFASCASGVTGTFTGKAEASTFVVNSRTLRINYGANDITLTDMGGAGPPVGSLMMPFFQ